MRIEEAFARVGAPPGEVFPEEGMVPLRPHRGGDRDAAMETSPFEDLTKDAWSANCDRPLALYLHTPFCRHRCLFCPFYKNRGSSGFSSRYRDALLAEIDLTADLLGVEAKMRPVSAIYFGGGTPSDLEAEDLGEVLNGLRKHFNVKTDTEVTVEGRVRGFSAEKAQAWVAAGANRFSLGLQSTDTALRRRLGRLADRAEIRGTLDGLCESGAVVIIDLIYGLPGQERNGMKEDIRFLAEETSIDGLDLYALKVFRGSPLEKAVCRGSLPGAASLRERWELFLATDTELSGQGFEAFTPKHWRRSLRERSLYNRLATEDADILPLGSAGGGRIGRYSLMQYPVLGDYLEALGEGRKPCSVRYRGHAPGATRKQELAASVNRCLLPPHREWGLPLGEAEALAANWLRAGLIEGPPPGKGDYRLTTCGAFWHEHITAILLALAGTH